MESRVGRGACRGSGGPGGGGHGTGCDRLQILLPGLPQVHVEIDEAWRDDLAACIHDHGAVGVADIPSDRLDPSLGQVHVGHLVLTARGIDYPAAADQDAATHRSSPFPAARADSGRPPASR